MTDNASDPDEGPFERRLQETGARDPRPYYRQLMKELKEADASRYDQVVQHYRTRVLTPIEAGEGDPLVHWLDFGMLVAESLHPGRAVRIEEDGRAVPFEAPPDYRELILHLPDSARTRAIPVGIPAEPTPAQSATLDLLVRGRTRLPEPA